MMNIMRELLGFHAKQRDLKMLITLMLVTKTYISVRTIKLMIIIIVYYIATNFYFCGVYQLKILKKRKFIF